MSKENVRLVREVYESFNQGNITQALDAFDPGVDWRISPEAGPSPESFRGHEGVRDAIASMLDVWRDYQSDPLEFIDRGEYVVARVCAQGTGRASGIEVEDEVAHLWRIREGRIVSFEAHLDSADALEAIKAASRH